MFESIFIRSREGQTLETLAADLFAQLNLDIKEARYSDNQFGDRFVYGEALGMRITLQKARDPKFPDYDFQLIFEPLPRIFFMHTFDLNGLAAVTTQYLTEKGVDVTFNPVEA
jgi:hypothetical protein